MDQRWRERAACLGMDTDMFLTAGKGRIPIVALRVCRGCPVRNECLDLALGMSEYDDAGVWGGTTEAARRRVRYGIWTREQAMQLGDLCADRETPEERAAA